MVTMEWVGVTAVMQVSHSYYTANSSFGHIFLDTGEKFVVQGMAGSGMGGPVCRQYIEKWEVAYERRAE